MVKWIVLSLGVCLLVYWLGAFDAVPVVRYAEDVKPLLNKHCLGCHGGVQKKGGYSLLFQEEAFGSGDSGKPGIVPGSAADSEIIRRLHHQDPEERMPYQKAPLTKEEIRILTAWIDQGAEWTDHWAYVPIEKPAVPTGAGDWAVNDIDHFIYQTAQRAGLQPMGRAEETTLKRRLALDLIGLPYEAEADLPLPSYLDSLLRSPHYGEKWASMWLDLARYADTKGYERDDQRSIWRYRDWLIKALNSDLPYDQFVVKQLAGDLLENPTEEDLIATAYHRNTMTNDEGGTDNEEYRVAAVLDRVNTTWEAFMGTTFACVQCHSHPYDPFRHEDYYRFMAYFNNTRDEDTFHDYPVIRHFDDSLRRQLAQLEEYLLDVDETRKDDIIHFVKTLQPSVNSIQAIQMVDAELYDTKFLGMRQNGQATLPAIHLKGINTLLFQARATVKKGTLTIRQDGPTGRVIGRAHLQSGPNQLGRWRQFSIPLDTVEGISDLHLSYFSPEISNRTTEGVFFNWFHFTKEFPGKDHPAYGKHQKLFAALVAADVPSTPILLENPATMRRATRGFERGSWLSLGAEVDAAIPGIFQHPDQDYAANRLGLAQWMSSRENPLLARTIVNRIWEQLFGTGLVETLEDMGSQALPSPHLPLLDYLSHQLMTEYDWSIKRLLTEIVSSATYQQASQLTEAQREKDPFNKLFARGPRVRLTGEQLRDQALFVAGVLNPSLYGEPVMPYQPEGIWNAPYNGSRWTISEGDNKYRRAIYTYWKRTSPYPSLITFDGVGREVCVARRIRTNTPLQALVTMNDSVYIDLSQQFAARVSQQATAPEEQITLAFQRATGKAIGPQQLDILLALYRSTREKYLADERLLSNISVPASQDKVAFAALAIVCNAILNLDEVVVKS